MTHFHNILVLLLTLPLLSSLKSFALSSDLPRNQHRCVNDQRSVLEQLRQDVLSHYSPSVTFDEFSSMTVEQWDLKSDCCHWEGVTCDTVGHVIGLNLSYSMISGHISSIFNLSHLQDLNLARNNFRLTPIPSGFERLTSLTRLNLSFSCFSDQIPTGIARLTKLISLDLSTISFCELPPTFNDPDFNRVFGFEELHRLRLEEPNLKRFVQNLSALRVLYLDSVDLSAQGSEWSDALSHALPNLEFLSLSNCRLSGSIHPSFSRLHNLSYIRLDDNNISSQVPQFLESFSNLQVLSLASCDLRGNFPKNVFLLPKLESIDLAKNPLLTGQLPEFSSISSLQLLSLYETSFHGELPHSIGNLKVLKHLILYTSNFSGLIPPSLANLTQLIELDISNNRISGSIPPFHDNGVPNLAELRFSNNLLNGSIHPSLFTLPSLNILYLDGNQFSGQLEEIPHAAFSVLESVFLGGNHLSGPIPSSISTPPSLVYLSLPDNNFSGSVKLDMFQNLQNLTMLDLSDNSLKIEPDDGSFTIPQLKDLRLNRCKLTEVPNFLQNEVQLTSLNLSDNHIQGFIPSWLWNSSTINELDLSMNAVDFPELLYSGYSSNGGPASSADGTESFAVLGKLVMRSCNVSRFPAFLRNQDSLWYLDLSDNRIDGQIPNWLWKNSLQYLNISHNYLHAVDEFFQNVSLTSLATLDLHANLLHGSLPKAVCNLSSLSILDASHNYLSGSIPDCFGKMGNLSVLNLRENAYHSIPQDFALASSLRSLNINSNRLEGQLPRSLANCTKLEVLDLGNNKMSDTFPFWLDKLPELKVLVLRANRFHGPIEYPGSKFVLPKLGIVDLSSNSFTGELSKEFFQSLEAMVMNNGNKSQPKYVGDYEYYQDSVTIMSKGFEMVLVRILTIFVSLDLSNNSFHGEIPQEMGNLQSLVVLNLSRNDITGHIPSSLGELTELESLDLSRNKISGTIPSQLTALTFLAVLNLSYNQLVGQIPQAYQFNTFSNDSYKGNIGLCGLPLSKTCKETDDKMPPPKEDDTSEKEIVFDWKVVLMGYGCGVVIGFSVGYMLQYKMEFLSFMNPGGQRRKQKGRSKSGRRFQSGR